MDERLTCLASLVRPGCRVADIGTDHAYLPVALVASGKCPSALACDVRKGPLENARRAVEAAGLADRIECRLGNGLSVVEADEADDIVIAGMGGELIASILAACPWANRPGHRFLLQPMTRAEALRRYLFAAGWRMESERTVAVGSRVYVILEAQPSAAPPKTDEVAALVGTVGERELTETDRRYLQKICHQLQTRLRAAAEHGGAAEAEDWKKAVAVLERRLQNGGNDT